MSYLPGGLSPKRSYLWKTGPSPVVSVGNIAVGGRGKTPLVAYVARLLVAAGERPAILSRGYARRLTEDGVVVVSDGAHVLADLDRSGDEPLMLARAVPGAAVLVCEQRAIAAALAERALGATVHVLDDGFQHRSMRRDIDIVALAPEDLRGRQFPFGRLRDSPSALRRADAIVIESAANGAPGLQTRGPDLQLTCPMFSMTRQLGQPEPIDPGHSAPNRGAAPVVALAGIARPERFVQSLEAAGWKVAALMPFPDHHQYSASDLARAAQKVRETGAAGILTTDKDAVRLRSLRPLPVPVAAVPLAVTIDPAREFDAWLLESIEKVRA